MTLVRDSSGLIILDEAACLQRLASRRVATLAITDLAMPLVLPVLYVLRGDHVVVSAHRTGVLGRRLPNSVVSLCVHDLDDQLQSGWTVSVVGEAQFVDDEELPDADMLRLWRTAQASDRVMVRISTERMSGRQLGA